MIIRSSIRAPCLGQFIHETDWRSNRRRLGATDRPNRLNDVGSAAARHWGLTPPLAAAIYRNQPSSAVNIWRTRGNCHEILAQSHRWSAGDCGRGHCCDRERQHPGRAGAGWRKSPARHRHRRRHQARPAARHPALRARDRRDESAAGVGAGDSVARGTPASDAAKIHQAASAARWRRPVGRGRDVR